MPLRIERGSAYDGNYSPEYLNNGNLSMRRRCQSSEGDGVEEKSEGKSIRMVNVGGCDCPCGGTHIASSGEIQEKLIISKLKRKKNILKVSYQLE